MTPHRDQGFTLTEVLVALALLTIVAAGAAELTTVAARTAHVARASTSALALAVQKLEQLRSIMWAVADDGTLLTDEWTDVSVDPAAASGSGTRPSPAGALTDSMNGFADYLNARGEWVGSGASPPADAVFVRRWSIERLPASGDRTLVLRVLVTARAAASGRAALGATAALNADAVLVSIRTRTGR